MNDLDPYEFDQTQLGWQALDSEGKYLEAAQVIENYILANEPRVKAQDRISIQTLYFHAGQEYAMAGPNYYANAIDNMKNSYKQTESWNIYVGGTIAFLSGDTSSLKNAIEKLTKLSQMDERLSANVGILERLLSGLGKSAYAVLYDADRF